MIDGGFMSTRTARAFSFEFFPPKGESGAARLRETTRQLAPLKPHYVSVTFGAGGTTRDGTYQAVRQLRETTGLDVVPHLSCMGVSREHLEETLQRYQALGVRRIVALRGDPPQNGQPVRPGAFTYANELVAFIRQFGGFSTTVGCYPEFHPESPNPETDMRHFARKVQAGADEAISQYFFNNDAYYAFVDNVRRLGVEIPIIAGIMPITDYAQIARFSAFCGADIPAWIRKRMEAFADDPRFAKGLRDRDRHPPSRRSPQAGRPVFTSTRSTRPKRRCAFGRTWGSSPPRGAHRGTRRLPLS